MTANYLKSSKPTEAGDERLHGVDEWVDRLRKAARGGALLRLLHEGLEGGYDLLERRNNSAKGGTEAGLIALHHLVKLAKDIADDWGNNWRSRASTEVDAIEGRL